MAYVKVEYDVCIGDETKRIHVLLMEHEKSGDWSAQCLDYDIAMQAKGLNGIIKEVVRTLNCHLAYAKKHSTKPFANYKKAPTVFWQMWLYSEPTEMPQSSNVRPKESHLMMGSAQKLLQAR